MTFDLTKPHERMMATPLADIASAISHADQGSRKLTVALTKAQVEDSPDIARGNLVLILFSSLVVAFMVGGTLVVLFNLQQRMM